VCDIRDIGRDVVGELYFHHHLVKQRNLRGGLEKPSDVSMDVSSLSQFGGNTATSSFGVIQNVQSAENAGNRVGQLSLRLDF
jgi:hypothetical protein